MKNIHVLPTDKPSRLFYNKIDSTFVVDNDFENTIKEDWFQDYNIYITSDEEIENCWFVNLTNGKIGYIKNNIGIQKNAKKIILTTDQDLIKDGVQAIPEYFLKWYIEKANDSGKPIDILEIKSHLDSNYFNNGKINYQIIIPKEEPKQETTLEEVAFNAGEKEFEEFRKLVLEANRFDFVCGFTSGAKWKEKRMCSEEEVLAFGEFIFKHSLLTHTIGVKCLFEQFKNK